MVPNQIDLVQFTYFWEKVQWVLYLDDTYTRFKEFHDFMAKI